MSKLHFIRSAIFIFTLLVCFILTSFKSISPAHMTVMAATQNACVSVTKEQLVKSIYDKIKVKYEGQRTHINVSVKDNVVTLDGWATTKQVSKMIVRYARITKCVKSVVNNLSIGVGAGCTRQQIKCGDICIGSDRDCNI